MNSLNPDELIQTGQATIKKRAPRRENLAADLIAAFTFAMVNIPQALATALLATVNPVFGLYTLMIATPVAAIFTSSVFMNVSTTSALAVAAGDAVGRLPAENKAEALVVLVIMIGIVQLLFGLFRLGSLMRFVSNAVMVGFMTGVAVLIILGQMQDLTGYDSPFSNKILILADSIIHFKEVDLATLAIGLLTIALILLIDRTRLRKFSYFLAMFVTTALVVVLSLDSVAQVGDITQIFSSLPKPNVPVFRYVGMMLDSAIAIAIIGLVQGAGVSQTYPNPDGKYPNVSRDFMGQGIANIATGFFQGIPAGGSLSGTSLMVNSGQKTRWANIFSGIFVALGVLLFANFIELLPMSALAGLLIVIGIRSIDLDAIQTVWNTNIVASTAMILTFAATLLVPLQVAVFSGVIVSILLYVIKQSNQVRIVQWVWDEQTFPIEEDAPTELSQNQIVALNVYGSLFFAGASTFEDKLPAPETAKHTIVIVGLRGRQDIGSTLITVLQRYAETLQAHDSKLMLVGVSETVHKQLSRTGALASIGAENVFPETDRIGEALNSALKVAHAWIANHRDSNPTDQPGPESAE